MNKRFHSRWLAGILLTVAGVYGYFPSPAVPKAILLRPLPTPWQIGNWECRSTELATVDGLRADLMDLGWSGICTDSHDSLHLFVGWMSHQSSRRRLQSPALTLVGNQVHTESVELHASTGTLPVRQLVGQKSTGQSEAILYWYDLGNQALANDYLLRWTVLARRLLNQGTAGAVIRIGFTTSPGGDSRLSFSGHQELARAVFPVVRKILKGESDFGTVPFPAIANGTASSFRASAQSTSNETN